MQVVHVGPRRCAGDRGAALVEAGLISPIFIFFLLAVFEFGSAFLAYLAVGNTVSQTARAASIFGSNGLADYQIVQAARQESTVLDEAEFDYIVVWHASGPTANIKTDAPGCAGGAVSVGSGSPNWTNACNVYTPAQFTLPATSYGCSASSPDQYWCPTDRKDAATDDEGNLADYVGIYVMYEHKWASGLFGDSLSFDDYKVVRIEPTRLS